MDQNNHMFNDGNKSQQLSVNNELTYKNQLLNYWLLPDGRKVTVNDVPGNVGVNRNNTIDDYSKKFTDNLTNRNNSNVQINCNVNSHNITSNQNAPVIGTFNNIGNNHNNNSNNSNNNNTIIGSNNNNNNVNKIITGSSHTDTNNNSTSSKKNNKNNNTNSGNTNNVVSDFYVVSKGGLPSKDGAPVFQTPHRDTPIWSHGNFKPVHSNTVVARNVSDSKYLSNGLKNGNYPLSATNENALHNNMTNWPVGFTNNPNTYVPKDVNQQMNVTNVDHLKNMNQSKSVNTEDNNNFYIMQNQDTNINKNAPLHMNSSKMGALELNMQSKSIAPSNKKRNSSSVNFNSFNHANNNLGIYNNSNEMSGSTNLNVPSNLNGTSNRNRYSNFLTLSNSPNISFTENETRKIQMKSNADRAFYNTLNDNRNTGIAAEDGSISSVNNSSNASAINRLNRNNEAISGMVQFPGNSEKNGHALLGNHESFNRAQGVNVCTNARNPTTSIYMNTINNSNNALNRNNAKIINELNGVPNYNVINRNTQTVVAVPENNIVPTVLNKCISRETDRELPSKYQQLVLNKNKDSLHVPFSDSIGNSKNMSRKNVDVLKNTGKLDHMNNRISEMHNADVSQEENMNISNFNINDKIDRSMDSNNIHVNDGKFRGTTDMNDAEKMNPVFNGSRINNTNNYQNEMNNAAKFFRYNASELNHLINKFNNAPIYYQNMSQPAKDGHGLYVNTQPSDILEKGNGMNDMTTQQKLPFIRRDEYTNIAANGFPNAMKNPRPNMPHNNSNAIPNNILDIPSNSTTHNMPHIMSTVVRNNMPKSIPNSRPNAAMVNSLDATSSSSSNVISNKNSNTIPNNSSNIIPNNMPNIVSNAMEKNMPVSMPTTLQGEYKYVTGTSEQERRNAVPTNVERLNASKHANYQDSPAAPFSTSFSTNPQLQHSQQDMLSRMVPSPFFPNSQNINMQQHYNPNYVNNNMNHMMKPMTRTFDGLVPMPSSNGQMNEKEHNAKHNMYENKHNVHTMVDMLNHTKGTNNGMEYNLKKEEGKEKVAVQERKSNNKGKVKNQKTGISIDSSQRQEVCASAMMSPDVNIRNDLNPVSTSTKKEKVTKGKQQKNENVVKMVRKGNGIGIVDSEYGIGDKHNNNEIIGMAVPETNNVVYQSQNVVTKNMLIKNQRNQLNFIENSPAICVTQKGNKFENNSYNESSFAPNEVSNNCKESNVPNTMNCMNIVNNAHGAHSINNVVSRVNNVNNISNANNMNGLKNENMWKSPNLINNISDLDLLYKNTQVNGNTGNIGMMSNVAKDKTPSSGAQVANNMNIVSVMNEDVKKKKKPISVQHKVDSKFIWLFLKKEFNENKEKYMSILPTIKHFYPDKLNELIYHMEKMNLLTFTYILQCSIELQAKYQESKNILLKNAVSDNINLANIQNNTGSGMNNISSTNHNTSIGGNQKNWDNRGNTNEIPKENVAKNTSNNMETKDNIAKERGSSQITGRDQNTENANNVLGNIPRINTKQINHMKSEKIDNEGKSKVFKNEVGNNGNYFIAGECSTGYMKSTSTKESYGKDSLEKQMTDAGMHTSHSKGISLSADAKTIGNTSSYTISSANNMATYGNGSHQLSDNNSNRTATLMDRESMIIKHRDFPLRQEGASTSFGNNSNNNIVVPGNGVLCRPPDFVMEKPVNKMDYINHQKNANVHPSNVYVQNNYMSITSGAFNENCVQKATHAQPGAGNNLQNGNLNSKSTLMTTAAGANYNTENMYNQRVPMLHASHSQMEIVPRDISSPYESIGKKEMSVTDAQHSSTSIETNHFKKMHQNERAAENFERKNDAVRGEADSNMMEKKAVANYLSNVNVSINEQEKFPVNDAENKKQYIYSYLDHRKNMKKAEVDSLLLSKGVLSEKSRADNTQMLLNQKSIDNATTTHDVIVNQSKWHEAVRNKNDSSNRNGYVEEIDVMIKNDEKNSIELNKKKEELSKNHRISVYEKATPNNKGTWGGTSEQQSTMEAERHKQEETTKVESLSKEKLNVNNENFNEIDKMNEINESYEINEISEVNEIDETDDENRRNKETFERKKKNEKKKDKDSRKKRDGKIIKELIKKEKGSTRGRTKSKKNRLSEMGYMMPYRNLHTADGFYNVFNRFNACGTMLLNCNKRNLVMNGFHMNSNGAINIAKGSGYVPIKKNKGLKRSLPSQENFGTSVVPEYSPCWGLNQAVESTTPEMLKRKFKNFNFCINKVFNRNQMGDIITLNENIKKNKDLLSLFNKKDLLHLKEKNFYYFMDTLQFQKIDFLIMKRIKIFIGNLSSALSIPYELKNVEEILSILKKAFENRIKILWPLIKFANTYRLDQLFHLLGKHRFHINSKLKDVQLVAKQNTSSLVTYFNQRIIDDQLVGHIKNQLRIKKKKKKGRQKMGDFFVDERGYNLFDNWSSAFYCGIKDNSGNVENAKTKANEFAFIGYNQKRLLTQITPHDYKTVLNFEFCKNFFSENWKKQQELFINNLHFDMTPDTIATKDHFENLYKRYMGYLKNELTIQSINRKKKEKKTATEKERTKQLNKKKRGAKRKTATTGLSHSNDVTLKKARKKYTKTKLKKKDIQDAQNGNNTNIPVREQLTNELTEKEACKDTALVKEKGEVMNIIEGIDANGNIYKNEVLQNITKKDKEKNEKIKKERKRKKTLNELDITAVKENSKADI